MSARRALLGALRFYQRAISPAFPPRCRFVPTCSAYAVEAVERHGAARGSWLAVKRLAKCAPWHPGGVDLVPERPPRDVDEQPPAARGTAGAGRSSSTAAPCSPLEGPLHQGSLHHGPVPPVDGTPRPDRVTPSARRATREESSVA